MSTLSITWTITRPSTRTLTCGAWDGKVKMTFVPKYGPAGGAGEEKEYAQIWDRSVSVASRCPGKGSAKDKLVLNTAARQIRCAKEEEEITTEMEEPAISRRRRQT